jgi:hypothetical protein
VSLVMKLQRVLYHLAMPLTVIYLGLDPIFHEPYTCVEGPFPNDWQGNNDTITDFEPLKGKRMRPNGEIIKSSRQYRNNR